MEPNTDMAALWDAVAPGAFAAVVEVFAQAGVGVLITPVIEEETTQWEEDASE
jgi:hypothetical protein